MGNVKSKAKSITELSQQALDESIGELTTRQLKEMLLITQYKLAFAKAQIETLSEILVQNKLATYEEIWKKSNIHFKRSK